MFLHNWHSGYYLKCFYYYSWAPLISHKSRCALFIYLFPLILNVKYLQLSGVTSPSMLSVLLKHIHQMVPFIVCFADIAQRTLRRMVELWCSNEDVVRVLSFLCALKIVNNRRSLLRPAIKVIYPFSIMKQSSIDTYDL